jgi:hypothetical protein
MDVPLVARLAQAVVTAALVGLALRWVQRAAHRRRVLAREVDGVRVLAYPPLMTWLGVGGMLGFGVIAVVAWNDDSGGPLVGSVFALFALLGLVLVVSANADTFLLDESGVERRRFGRPTRVRWTDLSRVTWARSGGINLEGRNGERIPVPQMLDGFGALCDDLLRRAPAGVRSQGGASACVVFGSTLDAAPLQHAYARWFEHEDAEPPPPGLDGPELAAAAGRAFAYRMLERHGSFVPFEARWTPDGIARITHGEPHRGEPGWAAFSFEDGAIVIDDGTRRWREPVDGWN